MYLLSSIIVFILLFIIFKNHGKLKNLMIFILTIVSTYMLYKIQFISNPNIISFKFNINNLLTWILDNILMNFIFINIINYKKINIKIKKNLKFKYLFVFIFIIALTTFLELFIFNFRHYESLNYKEETLKNIKINNLNKNNNNNNYQILKNNYIEFNNINKEIKNLYIDIIPITTNKLNYTILATDEANELYFELPKRTLVQSIDQSKYIKMNLSGKTKKLKIIFDTTDDTNTNLNSINELHINNIKINVIKPMYISLIRVFIISFGIYILYLIRPKSELYKFKLTDNKNKKYIKLIIISYIILQSIFFIGLTNINSFFRNPVYSNQIQYNKLAESLKNKRVDIDEPVSNTLKKLKNPYDTTVRILEHEKNKDYLLYDFAYYKGKYYVYFGIVPAILFYYPIYSLTGIHMQNNIVICTLLIFISILVLKFVKYLCNKYFTNISIVHYLMISCLFINASFLLYAAKRPDFYSVPIISALFFTGLGLYLWITSLNNDKLNRKRLFIGSLSMALVAGCRPQFLLGSFLCFPIFYKYFKNNKDIKDIFCFIFPYILIAIPLMYYNYIRFESPFDFGANYNLTTNDMTKRGFKFDRTMLGIFYSLFALPNISPIFPFISTSNVKTLFMGNTIWEPSFSGLLFINLTTILGILAFKFKKIINNNKLYYLCVTCNIFALIIIVADTQMAGVLPRYILDFSWLICISTTIVLLSILNNIKDKKIIYISNTVFYIVFTITMIYNIMLIPVDFSFELSKTNPHIYYYFYYITQFWL